MTKLENYNFSLTAKAMQSEEETKIRQLIMNTYLLLFRYFKEDFRSVEHNLNGLSKLVEPLVSELDKNTILELLDMLGKDKIDNYHPDFIIRLVDYWKDNHAKLTEDSDYLISFASKWPRFLKNDILIGQLLKIDRKTNVQDKRDLADILWEMLVFEPKVMREYFDACFLMKNKAMLSEYMDNFIAKASYIGYTNFDVKKMILAFRVLYPNPREVNSKNLLNFLVVLSASSTYYKSLDDKSVAYIENCLDVVEETFSGKRVMHVNVNPNPDEKPNTIKIEYFDKIQTSDKNYSKSLKIDPDWLRSYKYVLNHISEDGEYEIAEEFKLQKDLEDKNLDGSSESSEELLPDEEVSHVLDDIAPDAMHTQKHPTSDSSEIDFETAEQDADPQIKFTDEAKNENNETDNIEKILKSPSTQASDLSFMYEPKVKEKKIYDTKFREELDPEDIKVAMLRKKKINDMNYKTKHLLLFSNVDTNEYTNLNLNDYAKAWAVLYNFRNKSLDSPLYDEVENILARNTSGKLLSLRIFQVFHSEILNVALHRNYHINYNPKCQVTGWPIDISITKDRNDKKKLGFIFVLQEDICYDISKKQQSLLGMQKIILKQLEAVSGFKIVPIFENDFQSQLDKFDYIDRLVSEHFMKMQSD